MLRYFGPNELTFLRNFNKTVVRVEFVRVVYLRFYKALKRAPLPWVRTAGEESGNSVVRGEVMGEGGFEPCEGTAGVDASTVSHRGCGVCPRLKGTGETGPWEGQSRRAH